MEKDLTMPLTTDPTDPDLHTTQPDGQRSAYLILSDAERAKGFERPVRLTYVHRMCGAQTTMARDIAATYARQHDFYTATYCCKCRAHFALFDATGQSAFAWLPDGTAVGS